MKIQAIQNVRLSFFVVFLTNICFGQYVTYRNYPRIPYQYTYPTIQQKYYYPQNKKLVPTYYSTQNIPNSQYFYGYGYNNLGFTRLPTFPNYDNAAKLQFLNQNRYQIPNRNLIYFNKEPKLKPIYNFDQNGGAQNEFHNEELISMQNRFKSNEEENSSSDSAEDDNEQNDYQSYSDIDLGIKLAATSDKSKTSNKNEKKEIDQNKDKETEVKEETIKKPENYSVNEIINKSKEVNSTDFKEENIKSKIININETIETTSNHYEDAESTQTTAKLNNEDTPRPLLNIPQVGPSTVPEDISDFNNYRDMLNVLPSDFAKKLKEVSTKNLNISKSLINDDLADAINSKMKDKTSTVKNQSVRSVSSTVSVDEAATIRDIDNLLNIETTTTSLIRSKNNTNDTVETRFEIFRDETELIDDDFSPEDYAFSDIESQTTKVNHLRASPDKKRDNSENEFHVAKLLPKDASSDIKLHASNTDKNLTAPSNTGQVNSPQNLFHVQALLPKNYTSTDIESQPSTTESNLRAPSEVKHDILPVNKLLPKDKASSDIQLQLSNPDKNPRVHSDIGLDIFPENILYVKGISPKDYASGNIKLQPSNANETFNYDRIPSDEIKVDSLENDSISDQTSVNITGNKYRNKAINTYIPPVIKPVSWDIKPQSNEYAQICFLITKSEFKKLIGQRNVKKYYPFYRDKPKDTGQFKQYEIRTPMNDESQLWNKDEYKYKEYNYYPLYLDTSKDTKSFQQYKVTNDYSQLWDKAKYKNKAYNYYPFYLDQYKDTGPSQQYEITKPVNEEIWKKGQYRNKEYNYYPFYLDKFKDIEPSEQLGISKPVINDDSHILAEDEMSSKQFNNYPIYLDKSQQKIIFNPKKLKNTDEGPIFALDKQTIKGNNYFPDYKDDPANAEQYWTSNQYQIQSASHPINYGNTESLNKGQMFSPKSIPSYIFNKTGLNNKNTVKNYKSRNKNPQYFNKEPNYYKWNTQIYPSYYADIPKGKVGWQQSGIIDSKKQKTKDNTQWMTKPQLIQENIKNPDLDIQTYYPENYGVYPKTYKNNWNYLKPPKYSNYNNELPHKLKYNSGNNIYPYKHYTNLISEKNMRGDVEPKFLSKYYDMGIYGKREDNRGDLMKSITNKKHTKKNPSTAPNVKEYQHNTYLNKLSDLLQNKPKYKSYTNYNMGNHNSGVDYEDITDHTHKISYDQVFKQKKHNSTIEISRALPDVTELPVLKNNLLHSFDLTNNIQEGKSENYEKLSKLNDLSYLYQDALDRQSCKHLLNSSLHYKCHQRRHKKRIKNAERSKKVSDSEEIKEEAPKIEENENINSHDDILMDDIKNENEISEWHHKMDATNDEKIKNQNVLEKNTIKDAQNTNTYQEMLNFYELNAVENENKISYDDIIKFYRKIENKEMQWKDKMDVNNDVSNYSNGMLQPQHTKGDAFIHSYGYPTDDIHETSIIYNNENNLEKINATLDKEREYFATGNGGLIFNDDDDEIKPERSKSRIINNTKEKLAEQKNATLDKEREYFNHVNGGLILNEDDDNDLLERSKTRVINNNNQELARQKNATLDKEREYFAKVNGGLIFNEEYDEVKPKHSNSKIKNNKKEELAEQINANINKEKEYFNQVNGGLILNGDDEVKPGRSKTNIAGDEFEKKYGALINDLYKTKTDKITGSDDQLSTSYDKEKIHNDQRQYVNDESHYPRGKHGHSKFIIRGDRIFKSNGTLVNRNQSKPIQVNATLDKEREYFNHVNGGLILYEDDDDVKLERSKTRVINNKEELAERKNATLDKEREYFDQVNGGLIFNEDDEKVTLGRSKTNIAVDKFEKQYGALKNDLHITKTDNGKNTKSDEKTPTLYDIEKMYSHKDGIKQYLKDIHSDQRQYYLNDASHYSQFNPEHSEIIITDDKYINSNGAYIDDIYETFRFNGELIESDEQILTLYDFAKKYNYKNPKGASVSNDVNRNQLNLKLNPAEVNSEHSDEIPGYDSMKGNTANTTKSEGITNMLSTENLVNKNNHNRPLLYPRHSELLITDDEFLNSEGDIIEDIHETIKVNGETIESEEDIITIHGAKDLYDDKGLKSLTEDNRQNKTVSPDNTNITVMSPQLRMFLAKFHSCFGFYPLTFSNGDTFGFHFEEHKLLKDDSLVNNK